MICLFPRRWVFTKVATLQHTATNLVRWISAIGRAPRARTPRWRASAWAAIVLGIAVIIATMFLLDAATSAWARHLPHRLVDFAEEITVFGLSGWFLYSLAFILIFLAALTGPSLPPFAQEIMALFAARAGFLFTAIALPSLFGTIIKRIIGRARPFVAPLDDPFVYRPFAWQPEYASMPSGHATTAAAAAIAFGAIWPRWRAVMWLYALIIMLTRVVLNVHHPSDVLAGALVGIVGALLVRCWFAARELTFTPDLRAKPGPSWEQLDAVVHAIAQTPIKSKS